MSQALYRHLADTRPGVVVDVVAPPATAPLLQRMPEVRRAIELPVAHGELALGLRRRLGATLRWDSYEQAIVLPNSFKSALLPWFARIPRRTGWRGEMRYGLLNDLRVLDPGNYPRMVQRFLALGLPAGAPLPAQSPRPALLSDSACARRLAAARGIDPGAPLLALCPGAAFGGAKRWPADYFADLARQYLDRGWHVALFGSPAEAGLCAGIAADAGDPAALHSLAGETDLLEALDLLSLASAVVSNDSGLMHMAAALDRPLLAIYGPTSPVFTPPLAAAVSLLEPDIDCAPCHARECPLGHHRCMRDTAPATVAAGLDALLSAAKSVARSVARDAR